MNFIAKYTVKNAKATKSKSILLISSVVLASLLFIVSIVLPTFLKNYFFEEKFTQAGTADIVVSTKLDEEIQNLYSANRIPGEYMSNNIEYFAPMFAFFGTLVGKNGKQSNINVTASTASDFNKIGGDKLLSEGSVGYLSIGETIISSSIAKKFDVAVGDKIKINQFNSDYNFNIIGIAEDKGIFLNGSTPVIIISKDSLKQIFPIYSSSIFNIAFVKVKNENNLQDVLNTLMSIFPLFVTSSVASDITINQGINNVVVPYYIGASIGLIFCLLIIFMTSNLLFSKRMKEFTTLKSMGVTNNNIVLSCMFESMIYGFMGGFITSIISGIAFGILKSVKMQYSVFYGVSFWVFLLPILFGMVFSTISAIIPAISSSKASIRQQLIKFKKFDTKEKIKASGVSLFLIGAFITIPLIKIGHASLLAMALFFAILILANFAIPAFVYLTTNLAQKMKRRSYSLTYIKNNSFQSNANMVSRILCFGLTFMMVLSVVNTTIERNGYDFSYNTNVNAYIEGIKNYDEADFNYLNSISGVENVYETYLFKYLDIYEDNIGVFKNYALHLKDLKRMHGDAFEDKEQTFKNFEEMANPAILNIGFKHIKNYSVGDKIKIRFNGNNNFIKEFQIAGFVTGQVDGNSSIIFNFNNAKTFANDFLGTFRVDLKITNGYFDDVSNTLNTEFFKDEGALIDKTLSDDAQFAYMQSPVKMIYAYSIFVALLCVICVAIGYLLAANDNKQQTRLIYLQGTNKKQFLRMNFFQNLFINLIALVCGLATVALLAFNFSKMTLWLGMYSNVETNWQQILTIAGVSLVVTTALSLIIAAKSYVDVSKIETK